MVRVTYPPKKVDPPEEVDPTGRDQHEPGAKLDAGKIRVGLVFRGFWRALRAVCRVGTDGAVEYTDDGWKSVPDASCRYTDALGRHWLAHLGGERIDPKSGNPTAAHIAWNALAILELELEEAECQKPYHSTPKQQVPTSEREFVHSMCPPVQKEEKSEAGDSQLIQRPEPQSQNQKEFWNL